MLISPHGLGLKSTTLLFVPSAFKLLKVLGSSILQTSRQVSKLFFTASLRSSATASKEHAAAVQRAQAHRRKADIT